MVLSIYPVHAASSVVDGETIGPEEMSVSNDAACRAVHARGLNAGGVAPICPVNGSRKKGNDQVAEDRGVGTRLITDFCTADFTSLPNSILLVCLLVHLFGDMVSLCSFGCPGTPYRDQAGLKQRSTCFSEYWNQRHVPPCSASRGAFLCLFI